MKEEARRWFKKAKQDLSSAKYNYKGRKYDVSAFLCQQSAEKALKALLFKKSGEIRKIHDLVELGKNVGLPSDLLDKAKELTLAYTYSRYPDVQEVKNLSKIVKKFLKVSEEILKWVGKNI